MFSLENIISAKNIIEDMQYHMVQVKYPLQVPGGLPIDYGDMVMRAAKPHIPPFILIGHGRIGQYSYADLICKGEDHINDFVEKINQEAPFAECIIHKPDDEYFKIYDLN